MIDFLFHPITIGVLIVLFCVTSFTQLLLDNFIFPGKHRIIKYDGYYYAQKQRHYFFIIRWWSIMSKKVDEWVILGHHKGRHRDIESAKLTLAKDIPSRYTSNVIEVVWEPEIPINKKQTEFDKAKEMIQEALNNDKNMQQPEKELLQSILKL